MADGRESHGANGRDRRWWRGVAIGSAVFVAGGIVTAYVIANRGSPVSKRSTTRPPITSQSTAPQSTAPQPSVPPSSGPCGGRRAVTVPAPSGGDDTAALNALFVSAPNDSCVAFVRATYQVSGTLAITGKSGLDVRGNGAVLAARTQADRNRRHLVIAKSSNITVNDLHVVGANQQHLRSQAELEAQHGVEIADHSNGIRLVNLRVEEVYGDAIYIGGDSTDVLVQGGAFSHTGRQGIAVTAAKGVTLDGFTVQNAGRYCIDLEPNVPRVAVEQVTIRNTSANCPKGWLIVHSVTVRGVYSGNNSYNGTPMPDGRLTPGIYPKRPS
jgi:hypothetical protein